MNINKIIKIALSASALTISVATSTQVSAVTLVNAGFNDDTGWALANDATLAETGGTAPWSWNTPEANNTVTSTEDVFPTEGDGFGITYGGFDSFTQSVDIPTSGDYVFSIEANALTGSVFTSTGSTFDLTDGGFEFFAGDATSSNMNVTATDGWVTYTWTTTLDAGLIDIGIRTTDIAKYSIAFDNFSVTLVPVPAAVWLFGSGLIGLIAVARRKKA